VIAFLSVALKAGVPVTVAGAARASTGGRVPQGGPCFPGKTHRLEIREGRAIAGAGLMLAELQCGRRRSGQFYPPDPTETSAAIGVPSPQRQRRPGAFATETRAGMCCACVLS